MRKNYEIPTPSHPLAIPTEDEFFAWCENPVTQFVALAYKIVGDLQKEDWIKKSWDGQNAESLELNTLRTRQDAYYAFLETKYERYLEIVNTKSPLK